MLDLDPDATVGYRDIRIRMRVDADAPQDSIDELIAFAKAHSPVCNTICRAVDVNLERVDGATHHRAKQQER